MTTNVMTYLLYEDLFKYLEKGGLTLPLSYLNNEKIIDELIDERIKDIDPNVAISYSSFLNLVVQTLEPEESARLGRKEIGAVGFKKDIQDNKVFPHGDCLLHMMSRIITSGKEGAIRITRGSDGRGTKKCYKALLLIRAKSTAPLGIDAIFFSRIISSVITRCLMLPKPQASSLKINCSATGISTAGYYPA